MSEAAPVTLKALPTNSKPPPPSCAKSHQNSTLVQLCGTCLCLPKCKAKEHWHCQKKTCQGFGQSDCKRCFESLIWPNCCSCFAQAPFSKDSDAFVGGFGRRTTGMAKREMNSQGTKPSLKGYETIGLQPGDCAERHRQRHMLKWLMKDTWKGMYHLTQVGMSLRFSQALFSKALYSWLMSQRPEVHIRLKASRDTMPLFKPSANISLVSSQSNRDIILKASNSRSLSTCISINRSVVAFGSGVDTESYTHLASIIRSKGNTFCPSSCISASCRADLGPDRTSVIAKLMVLANPDKSKAL